MSIEGKVDMSDVMSGLDVLSREIKTHLARSMAVAGGKVLRDEAKLRVPVKSGRLRDSIYLAYREKESVGPKVVYSVTWNSRNAPHGHLVEFGHWRYNMIINGKAQHSLAPGLTRGKGPQDHTGAGALATPVWTPALPFLRPAMDAAGRRAIEAMRERARVRLPELLAGNVGSGDEL